MAYKASGLSAAQISSITAQQRAIHNAAMNTVTDRSRTSAARGAATLAADNARGAAARAADNAHDKANKAYGSWDMGPSGAAGGNVGGACNEG